MLDNRCIGDKSRHQYPELSIDTECDSPTSHCGIQYAAYCDVGNRLKRYQHAENIPMSPTSPSGICETLNYES